MIKKSKIILVILSILMVFTLTACSEKKLDKESLEVISKSIKNTTYNEFSFTELMDQVNVKNKSVSIDTLDLSVDSEGNINSINMTYYLGSSNTEHMMIYRKKNDMFKIIETEMDNEYANAELDNKKILNILDGSFNLGEIERDDYDLYAVRLMSKGPMKSSHGDLSVFYNGMPIENDKAKDIEGITFFTYTSPIARDNNDNVKICIFSYN